MMRYQPTMALPGRSIPHRSGRHALHGVRPAAAGRGKVRQLSLIRTAIEGGGGSVPPPRYMLIGRSGLSRHNGRLILSPCPALYGCQCSLCHREGDKPQAAARAHDRAWPSSAHHLIQRGSPDEFGDLHLRALCCLGDAFKVFAWEGNRNDCPARLDSGPAFSVFKIPCICGLDVLGAASHRPLSLRWHSSVVVVLGFAVR